jgi:YibE/F-like protein
VGASLPLLVLFVTSGDAFGTVATAEAVAVEVVRTLCGSIGLIAAVPLTTVLAAALAPAEGEAHEGFPVPAAAFEPGPPGASFGPGLAAPEAPLGVAGAPLAERAATRPATAEAPGGRVAFSPARGLGQEAAMALFERVLALHGPRLSHASVAVAGGDWLGREALPADARRAAVKLQRLGTAARSGAAWYRRALSAGTVRLDLRDPGQLELLRRFGPFSTDARVWADGDPDPVVETAEALDDLPRATYRLTAGELDRLRAQLAEAGPAGAVLVPRRSRARR